MNFIVEFWKRITTAPESQLTAEKAIELYLKSEFEEARKLFTDVLRVNENDKVAVQYLMKCEEQINGLENGQFKKKFTGFLI